MHDSSCLFALGSTRSSEAARCTSTGESPGRLSSFPYLSSSVLEGVAGLPSTARIERYKCSLQACSLSLQGWGLIDLPLRASNEGSPRPRVARAQKIIRLHPRLLFYEPVLV